MDKRPRDRVAFRSDIEGLRAVAVLAVVFFHLGVAPVQGGFVGVDVFFVISGYLITRIISTSKAGGPFSLGQFYMRRVRRLAPALFVVLLVTVLAAALLMAPPHLEQFGRSLIAAPLFLSNFVFASERGYFDIDAFLKPALHTWSLGVEGQFYALWPLLLAAILKPARLRDRMAVFAALFAGSLAIDLLFTAQRSPAAFYLLPGRLFEFMFGAGVYLAAARIVLRPAFREAVFVAGLALILASAVIFSHETDWPGWAVLMPCAGSALVILTGEKARAAAVLRAAPVAFVGRISYSVYLVHWPLIVFWRYARGVLPGPLEQVILLVLTLAAGALLWRTVEVPFRGAAPRGHIAFTLRVAAAGAFVIALFGVALALSGGLPQRLDAQARAAGAAIVDRTDAGCIPLEGKGLRGCIFGADAPGAPAVLLFGDSHAVAYRPGLAAMLTQQGLKGLYVGDNGCPPLLGARLYRSGTLDRGCADDEDALAAALDALPTRIVLIAGRWSLYMHTAPAGADAIDVPPEVVYGTGAASASASSADAVAAALTETVARFTKRGMKVILLGEVPPPAVDMIMCFNTPALLAHLRDPASCAERTRAAAALAVRPGDALLTALASGDKGDVIAYLPSQDLCAGGTCAIRADGLLLFRDANHLSAPGAHYLMARHMDGVRAFILANAR